MLQANFCENNPPPAQLALLMTSVQPADLTAEEELYWLALRLTQGLGTRRAGQLLERLRTPQAIFRASVAELEGAGLPGALARSIASGISFEDAADQQQKARDAGVTLIPLHDARYPEPLRKIYDPPPLLFARGRAELMNSVAIGVVGTRRPTPYGLQPPKNCPATLPGPVPRLSPAWRGELIPSLTRRRWPWAAIR